MKCGIIIVEVTTMTTELEKTLRLCENRVIKRGVSLYPKDWQFLDVEGGRYGTSASAIIRRLIRDEQERRRECDIDRFDD